MHLSPLLDHPTSSALPILGIAHRDVLARGVMVLAVFAGLLTLAMAPRLIHRASVATTLAGYAAWDSGDRAGMTIAADRARR